MIERPDWDSFFMGLAFLASKRSLDESKQHGSVIVNSQNHVIGLGYNSFPKGVDDKSMPRTRPEKYFCTPHAEKNALLNCEGSKLGATLYVTGRPCASCFSDCINAGIKKIIAYDGPGHSIPPPGELEMFNLLLKQDVIEYKVIKPDLSWTAIQIQGEGKHIWASSTNEQPSSPLPTKRSKVINLLSKTAIGRFTTSTLSTIFKTIRQN